MNENEMLVRAAQLMIERQAAQVDKSGQAYFQHPMRVALSCETSEQKTVALLHDILEDTATTADELIDKGFPRHIVEAVVCLTRRAGESYEDFILRCSQNEIGSYVKIRDLEDNLNIMRLAEMTEADMHRVNKYLKSLRALKSIRNSKLK